MFWQKLAILNKYRRQGYIITLIFVLFGVGLSLILPEKFLAVARILPSQEPTDLLSSIATLPSTRVRSIGLARAAGIIAGGTPAELLAAIVQSRTIKEKAINKCNLHEYYNLDKSKLDDLLLAFENDIKIIPTIEGLVEIEVVNKDPKLAAKIANTLVKELDEFLRTSNMTQGKNMRIFLEKRVKEAKQELSIAEDSLNSFLKINKISGLDQEFAAFIEQYAKIKAQLVSKETKLRMYRIYGKNNPMVINLTREVNALRRSLNDIESSTKTNDEFGVGFSVPLTHLSTVQIKYGQLIRDLKVSEEVYALLIQQYETAKMTEARDTPRITIVDLARPPQKKFFPKRTLIVGLMLVLGVGASVFYAFASEYYKNFKKMKEFTVYRNLLNNIKEDFKILKGKVCFWTKVNK